MCPHRYGKKFVESFVKNTGDATKIKYFHGSNYSSKSAIHDEMLFNSLIDVANCLKHFRISFFCGKVSVQSQLKRNYKDNIWSYEEIICWFWISIGDSQEYPRLGKNVSEVVS